MWWLENLDTSHRWKFARGLTPTFYYSILRPIKAASVSGRSEWSPESRPQMPQPLWLPTPFCRTFSSLPCRSAWRKPHRRPQPQVQCPAFPITKIVHIRFSCDHHLLLKTYTNVYARWFATISQFVVTASSCMLWWSQVTHYSQVLVHSTVVNSRLSHRYIPINSFFID